MKFECPHCHQHLLGDPAMAGQVVRCPACNNRLQIPANLSPEPPEPSEAPSPAAPGRPAPPRPPAGPRSPAAGGRAGAVERTVWKETDPTNPNMALSFGIGVGLLIVWYLVLLPFNPPAAKAPGDYTAMQYVASLFYKHLAVSILNTLFFTWAMAIVWLKHRKLSHQRAALMLDVLPMHLGKRIDGDNVVAFIEHVYKLPAKLRDSLMVNRIRKALELFEIRQSVHDVREMMASQSEIDGARIGGSYTLLRAFLWAIPLLGFIGTVLGLSHAIGGMNFANVEDVAKIVGSINNVTSGLGTAFDATLLGLVLAMTLNFPLNWLAKQEDDSLNAIDAFCNEVLLPRLKDASGAGEGDAGAIADHVAEKVSAAQAEFLANLDALAKQMNGYAAALDTRIAAFQQSLSDEVSTKMNGIRAQADDSIRQSLDQVAKYVGGLEQGIRGLNGVLEKLGEKQVVIQAPPKKRGWFGRK
jgi:biopolymer transport protein ExbB/TolQ